MACKADPQQRQTNSQHLEHISTGGGAPPAPACGAKAHAQRPGHGTEAKKGPLRGAIGRAQLQLTRQIVHPEHGVGHKAKCVGGVGQKHQHHRQRPERGGGCRAGRSTGYYRDRRRGRQCAGAAPAQPQCQHADGTQAQPYSAQAVLRQAGHQRGREQGTHANAGKHHGAQCCAAWLRCGGHGHRWPQHHECSPGNAGHQPPHKKHGHGLGDAAGRKAQCHGDPAQHQGAHATQPIGQRRSRQRPDQIAQQIGSAQIGHLLTAEPARQHHLRHEGGIGKTGQSHAAEGGEKAGQKKREFRALDHDGGLW